MGRPPLPRLMVFSLGMSPKQHKFLSNLAVEKTRQLGRTVGMSNILRAMIDREMEDHKYMERVWDEET